MVTEGKRWVRRARSAQGRRLSSSFREVMPLKAWRQRFRSSSDTEVSRSRTPLHFHQHTQDGIEIMDHILDPQASQPG